MNKVMMVNHRFVGMDQVCDVWMRLAHFHMPHVAVLLGWLKVLLKLKIRDIILFAET